MDQDCSSEMDAVLSSAVDLVVGGKLTLFPEYGSCLMSPMTLEKAMRVLQNGKKYLTETALFEHLIAVTDFVICAYLNAPFYTMYPNESIQLLKIGHRITQLSHLWSHFFESSAPYKPLHECSLKMIQSWSKMLEGTDQKHAFNATLFHASTYRARFEKPQSLEARSRALKKELSAGKPESDRDLSSPDSSSLNTSSGNSSLDSMEVDEDSSGREKQQSREGDCSRLKPINMICSEGEPKVRLPESRMPNTHAVPKRNSNPNYNKGSSSSMNKPLTDTTNLAIAKKKKSQPKITSFFIPTVKEASWPFRGTLRGHSRAVTQIATNPIYQDMIVSCSQDASLIVWKLTPEKNVYGYPQKALTGHNNFVNDVTISSNGKCALSGSWDQTFRAWDLNKGKTFRSFVGHKGSVLSVALSPDDRQIVSGSVDRTVKLWTTWAECKHTFTGHSDWVSCVRFSPGPFTDHCIVSAGFDEMVKVWDLAGCKLKANLSGHSACVNTVALSCGGMLCASGDKDGKVMLWDLRGGRHMFTLDHNDGISALCFNPKKFWLCAAFGPSIKIWELRSKERHELRPEIISGTYPPICLSLAWSDDGQTLFAGYSDGIIRVWQVSVLVR